jgi:hypothetical protein
MPAGGDGPDGGAELHHGAAGEGRSANTIRQAKVVLGAMFGMAVADGYLDYNPFHDVKIPKVPGRRAIKIATPEQYLSSWHFGRLRSGEVPVRGMPTVGPGLRPRADACPACSRLR